MRVFKAGCDLLYLQRSKQHHLLLCAVNVLQEDCPAGLFIQLSQTHHVVLWRKTIHSEHGLRSGERMDSMANAYCTLGSTS